MHENSPRQLVVMTAIVATILIVPAGALVALGCLLAGVSPLAVLTFGGHMHAAAGIVAWWIIALLPAAIYSVSVTHV